MLLPGQLEAASCNGCKQLTRPLPLPSQQKKCWKVVHVQLPITSTLTIELGQGSPGLWPVGPLGRSSGFSFSQYNTSLGFLSNCFQKLSWRSPFDLATQKNKESFGSLESLKTDSHLLKIAVCPSCARGRHARLGAKSHETRLFASDISGLANTSGLEPNSNYMYKQKYSKVLMVKTHSKNYR